MSAENILSGLKEGNHNTDPRNTPDPPVDNPVKGTTIPPAGIKEPGDKVDAWAGVNAEYKEKVSKFKDIDGLAKGYAELEKKLSAGKKAPETDQEKEEMFKLLGRPDKADGYELPPLIEGENPLTDKFGITAHKFGLSREQAEGIYGWYAEELGSAHQTAKLEREDTVKTLKGEWQDKYTENVELASRALNGMFSETTIEKLVNTGLLNDQGFIATMAKIGASNANDTIGNINQKTREIERTDSGLPMLNFPSMKE